MIVFDMFRNYINSIAGRRQEFDELLAAGDISAVKDKMSNRFEQATNALREYRIETHAVMNREDKIIVDKRGQFIRKEKVWKLPVPYPVYINEVALVFLYGRPVKWVQTSEDTDEAFAAFQDVIKRTRFDSKIRQCKRLAGAETQSAMLFRVYKDEEGKPDVQIRVLAQSKGDEIYTRFDQYENLISVAWGYYVKEEKDQVIYHFDIFTKNIIYRCAKKAIGWKVVQEPNLIGKIPIILFQQDKEWAGVEPLIHREEYIASHQADTNDYFANPILILNADIIKNMPEKGEGNKTFITNTKEGLQNAATYLTWDSAPQSKKDEIEWLQTQILSKTFTPNITLDTLKSVSQLSAKALRTVMMLADIKASRHKETHDELLDRTSSLVKAIVGNVLDVSLHSQCEGLIVDHEFQEPFGEDIAEDINNLVQCLNNGLMSEETAVENNPLIKDSTREKERLSAEKEDRLETQQNIFGMDDAGAQSYTDGNWQKKELIPRTDSNNNPE